MRINRKYKTREGLVLDTFQKIAFFNEKGEIKPTQNFIDCWENGGHGSLDVFKLVKKNFNDGTCSYWLHAISDWSDNSVSFTHDVLILSMNEEEYKFLRGLN